MTFGYEISSEIKYVDSIITWFLFVFETGPLYVDQSVLELTEILLSVSQVLGLKECTTIPSQ